MFHVFYETPGGGVVGVAADQQGRPGQLIHFRQELFLMAVLSLMAGVGGEIQIFWIDMLFPDMQGGQCLAVTGVARIDEAALFDKETDELPPSAGKPLAVKRWRDPQDPGALGACNVDDHPQKDTYTYDEVFEDIPQTFTVREAAEYLEVAEITVRRDRKS